MMYNEVWVTWKDSTTGKGLVDTVDGLEYGAQIKDLRRAFVKQHEPDVRRATVEVRETEDGEMLQADKMLSVYFVPPADLEAASGPGKTKDNALFLTLPQQMHKSAMIAQLSSTSKRSKVEFELNWLLSVGLVPPPTRILKPSFVCEELWHADVYCKVIRELQTTDGEGGKDHRVAPMALVRCSRGGKTRALNEIANLKFSYNDRAVIVIFVSFNDFSDLDDDDQDNPLQALLQRIAFAALQSRYLENKGKTMHEQFRDFRRCKYSFSSDEIMLWLGDHPALLLVDELNNLNELTVRGSNKAKEFAEFVKQFFIIPQGRYFVFSTHIMSTLESFGALLDPSRASDRTVVLLDLPLVHDLFAARQNLDSALQGARQAIYYGLMPGLIYDRSNKAPDRVAVKRMSAMSSFNQNTTEGEREKAFVDILRSLVDGNVKCLPEAFHNLLDSSHSDSGTEMIRWVPYHLEYVLANMQLGYRKSLLAKAISVLCNQLLTAKESSGEGWEAVFVLFLLARCVSGSWHQVMLPEFAFQGSQEPQVVFNGHYNGTTFFSQIQTWDQLKSGIVVQENPTISIFFPTHAGFQAYDVFVVFSESREIRHVIGFQLKEGKSNAQQPVHSSVQNSFVVKGDPPEVQRTSSGWTIPAEKDINEFFGVSGEHWTPKRWKKLSATGVDS